MLKDRMRLKFGLSALACLAVIGMAKPVSACSCFWDGNWASHARDAEFVFIGKATSRTDTDPVIDSLGRSLISSDDPTVFDFEVEESIKNVQGEALQLWTVRDDASCGYRFQLDSSYLVFAYKPEGDSVLRTGSCSGNQKLGSAEPDSILTVVKAALATNSIRHSIPTLTRQRQIGAMQNLERKDRRLDGRHLKPHQQTRAKR